MKLADPTLLKTQCLIDGKWVGEGVRPIANPATGKIIAKIPRFGEAETAGAIEAAQQRLRSLGESVAESARPNPAPLVRPHHPKPRRHRPHHDQRAGQAARRGAGRGRLRRGLYRILWRGGQADLRRGQSDLPRRFAHRRHQAADRRGRGDHAVEFPRRNDHPQGRARARGRLHGGRQTRGRDAADRARARRTRAARRDAARRAQSRDRRRARDRQDRCANIRRCASSASPARPRSASS